MRVKINSDVIEERNSEEVLNMMKWILRTIINCGYSLSSINMYLSFKDEEGNIVEYNDILPPYYEIRKKEYKHTINKFLMAVYAPDSASDPQAYGYGSYDMPKQYH